MPFDPPVGSQVGIVINEDAARVDAGLDADGYQVSIDGYASGYVTLNGGFGDGDARTFVYFGDGGYAFGYRDVWYTIASGY